MEQLTECTGMKNLEKKKRIANFIHSINTALRLLFDQMNGITIVNDVRSRDYEVTVKINRTNKVASAVYTMKDSFIIHL